MPWSLNRLDDFHVSKWFHIHDEPTFFFNLNWWFHILDEFHDFKEFHMSLIVHFHDWYVSHNTCTLTLLVYSWFAFMRLWYELYGFWVFSDYVIYIWLVKNYFVFISLFEGSRSSFSRFSKTSSCSSLLVEIFKQTTLSNLFFLKTPTFNGRLDGRPWSSMFHLANHLKLNLVGR